MSAARNRYGFEGQSPDLEYQWWKVTTLSFKKKKKKVTNLTALQGKATKPRNNILYGERIYNIFRIQRIYVNMALFVVLPYPFPHLGLRIYKYFFVTC